MQASNPVGVMDLSDFQSAEDVTKKSKLFAKKDFTFQITTNRGAYLLQATSEEDRDDWIMRLKDAAAFAVFYCSCHILFVCLLVIVANQHEESNWTEFNGYFDERGDSPFQRDC